MIFFILLIILLGINLAFSTKVSKDKFTPGAIIPSLYLFFKITSKVVAVPKSKIIKLSLLLIILIAFASSVDPTVFYLHLFLIFFSNYIVLILLTLI